MLEILRNKSAKFSIKFDVDETGIMDKEVEKLVNKGVVVESQHELGQVVSNVFLRPKKDGNFRMVLDLSVLNKVVEYEHFKMSSLKTALELMRDGAWMCSVDLRDAYYTISVEAEFRKYLKFVWKGVLYQFTALPNGLACAPRFFTKILTPVFAELRKLGNECFFYIDDSFIIADTESQCREAARQVAQALDSLGFVIHQEKSVLEPQQSIEFLGFTLDSREMTVKLTQDKVDKFHRAAWGVLLKHKVAIREVAGLIGLMVA